MEGTWILTTSSAAWSDWIPCSVPSNLLTKMALDKSRGTFRCGCSWPCIPEWESATCPLIPSCRSYLGLFHLSQGWYCLQSHLHGSCRPTGPSVLPVLGIQPLNQHQSSTWFSMPCKVHPTSARPSHIHSITPLLYLCHSQHLCSPRALLTSGRITSVPIHPGILIQLPPRQPSSRP